MHDERRYPIDEVVPTKNDSFYRIYGGFRFQLIDEGQNGAPIGEPSDFFPTLEEARAAAIKAGGGEYSVD